MNRNQIKIDRLEIHLKGGDSNSARELGASIGEEILDQIAQQTSVARNRRSTRIGQLDAGTLSVGSDASASVSRAAIARQIAARVSSKVATDTSRSKG
jgi:hypothetical protein